MTNAQKWQSLAMVFIVGFLIYLLAPVLTPFVFAALFAYLGDPLVDRLEKWRLSRTNAVLIVFTAMTLFMVGIVLLLIPLIESQINRLVRDFPTYVQWFRETALPWLQTRFGVSLEMLDPAVLLDALKAHWQQAGGVATTVLSSVSRSGLAVIGWLANLLLIPVVTFYLMRDWDVLVSRVHELIPRHFEPVVSRLAKQSDEVLGAFLRGQVTVMIALALIYGVGLTAIGLNVGILIGLIAGLISFVPYLGAFVGITAAVIASMVQHGDVFHLVLVFAVFGVGQTVESFLLTPYLVGDKIGLHPVAVIFAIMAGGQLFGFLGVLLALPVAAVVMVVLRYSHERYIASTWYEVAQAPAKVAEEVVEATPLDVTEISAPAPSSKSESTTAPSDDNASAAGNIEKP